MKKQLITLITLAFLAVPICVYAGVPLDTVRSHVDDVLDVLRDKTITGDSASEVRKNKIRAISKKMFDYPDISRRTLGPNWRKFSPEERDEFIDLYSELLENVYINRILKYSDEEVEFRKEKVLKKGKKTEVQSFVITKTTEIPINYRMIRKKNGWRVYDVIIEGVSMTNNYRTQFKKMLMRKKPTDLIERLREKNSEKKADDKKKGKKQN